MFEIKIVKPSSLLYSWEEIMYIEYIKRDYTLLFSKNFNRDLETFYNFNLLSLGAKFKHESSFLSLDPIDVKLFSIDYTTNILDNINKKRFEEVYLWYYKPLKLATEDLEQKLKWIAVARKYFCDTKIPDPNEYFSDVKGYTFNKFYIYCLQQQPTLSVEVRYNNRPI